MSATGSPTASGSVGSGSVPSSPAPVTPSPRTSRSLQHPLSDQDVSRDALNTASPALTDNTEPVGGASITESPDPPLPPPPPNTSNTPPSTASPSTNNTVATLPRNKSGSGSAATNKYNEQDSRTMGGGTGLRTGGRRPVKVWNSGRTIRKALVVSTYEEFQRKGREKLGLSSEEPISIVLEGDGTQVDDGEYFQTLPENSIFMFLRTGESWHPTGSDSIKAAVMEAVPSIVCETLYSLGLHDQVPSWKIMDNKGRITVVLHWEPDEIAALRGTNLPAIAGPSRQSSTCSTIASGGPRLLGIHTRSISQSFQPGPIEAMDDIDQWNLEVPKMRSGSSVTSTPCLSRDNSRQGAVHQHSMLVQTSFDSQRENGGKSTAFGPHITVINHDVDAAKASAGGLLGPPTLSRGSSGGSSLVMGTPSPRQLSRQGSSMESTAIVPLHHHTVECSASGRGVHQPTTYSKQRGSPTSDCDFHCCALHSSSTPATTSSTTTHKSVTSVTSATSPMQQTPGYTSAEAGQATSGPSAATSGGGGGLTDGKRSLPKGAHVRFSHVEVDDGAAQDSGLTTAIPSTTANNQSASSGGPVATSGSSGATSSSAVGGSFQCRAIVETTTTMTRVATASEAVTTVSEIAAAAAAALEQGLEDSSESETDNNDETGTTDKFLLLIDQLSAEQPHHLSIKDIGIILDRLSSKIIDVVMLERQIEDSHTRNWTIKATIRGQVMRELGVIYNSNYYAISEHPSFSFSKRIHSSEERDGKPPMDEDMEDDMDDFEEVDHVNTVPHHTLGQTAPPLHQ